jgi:hypothetical protein
MNQHVAQAALGMWALLLTPVVLVLAMHTVNTVTILAVIAAPFAILARPAFFPQDRP